VTVTFRGQSGSATAEGGKWSVELPAGEAGGPFELTIAGKNTIALKDVLVGEVWVCSGQSNMQWSVNQGGGDLKKVVAESTNPKIRLFYVPRVTSDTPQDSVNAKWTLCEPTTVPGFSAVAYYFGRKVQAELGIPVGLIHTSWGGTRAEAWTSAKVLEKDAGYKQELVNFENAVKNFPKTLEAFKAAADKAKAEKKPLPKAPGSPIGNPNAPAVLYNAMIHPLLPYTIKGAIWYQGESNAGKAYAYRTLFPDMIKNWRADWGLGDFPFYFVQLATFQKVTKDPVESNWAELREAQFLTSKNLVNTGQAVITDLGHESDIHPTPKQPVGERLALLALSRTYGKKIVDSGPEYAGAETDGNKYVIKFNHVGAGLTSHDWEAVDKRGNGGSAWRVKPGTEGAPLQGFEIAGEDKKFVNAKAEIRGNTVVVSSEKIEKPVAVRFGWANHSLGNLFNKDGLPATPFRTDDWPGITAPKPAASK